MNALQAIRSTIAQHFQEAVQQAHLDERGDRRFQVGADQLVRIQVEGDRFESRPVLDISLNGLSVVGRVRTLPRERLPLSLRLNILGASCPVAFRVAHVSEARSGLRFVHDEFASLPFVQWHLALFDAGARLRIVDASILRAALANDAIHVARTPGLVDITVERGTVGRWLATLRYGKDWLIVRRSGDVWITGRTPANGGVFSSFVPDRKVDLGAIRLLTLILVGVDDPKTTRLTHPIREQCLACIAGLA